MIEVRFYRTGNIKNGHFMCANYKQKGIFTLNFDSVEELIGWYKRQFIRMTKIKNKSDNYNARVYVLPISPVNLREDLSEQDIQKFNKKYYSVVKKYFWRAK